MTAEPLDPDASGPDRHTTAGKLAELRRRTEQHAHAGSEAGSRSGAPSASAPPASGSTCCWMRARSSRPTPSPATARATSAWPRPARWATA